MIPNISRFINYLMINRSHKVLTVGKKAVGCKWVYTPKFNIDGSLERYKSPRAWFERFTKTMKSQGYKQNNADHTLFIKHNSCGCMTILIIYVNDILFTEFDIKSLGRLRYFLGIEVAHLKEGIFISQHKYTVNLLQETGQLACKPTVTLVDINVKLGAGGDSPPINEGSFQRLIKKLIYLNHTRQDYCIYTDTGYVGSVSDKRSTSGCCSFIGGNLVSWRSKKKNVVSRSSAGAKFRVMAQGICKHDRTKHIELDHHFIKENIKEGMINLLFINSFNQVADIFIKGAARTNSTEACIQVGHV
ncbi:unnamed protein product [Spirodela intermedia]|uniref:Reverse transcriptase Ty1/copia-type domain-containing protein n=1 Tax=Spirodela intermedia TaxID=51605 RepID=A0A7I8L159_SPIIN|nr:unnamed protein product [Spirodela intermedia]